jgi:DNA-binding response OmpR family regulator/predicted regulator of Ras-like GTPase activity (Roadblock/LC7/MglB family)
MSDQWRILVVEDEENLNWSIVNSLRKDGYFVRGVMNGAEAIRILWSEEYDVVISDLKMPGADGFELLQWIRAHRQKTRLIMVTAFGSASTRNQALEGGVVSYLEKPFDLHTLKEELRRLLQQTGFSANLDSFDLLDVIQIITMSRKSIALLVNTGLEERGVLRFQGGELIWAEYGSLRGEEAFFALAAHKNGVVIHQPWNEQITPNVTQPLSRLIFQALQYRTKYADNQQHSSDHEAVRHALLAHDEEDDTPFVVLDESTHEATGFEHTETKEWWQQTGSLASPDNGRSSSKETSITSPSSKNIIPSTVRKTPAGQRSDLPSWLTDQPTHGMPVVRRPSPTNPVSSRIPVTPALNSSTAEWQPPAQAPSTAKAVEQTAGKQATGPQKKPPENKEAQRPGSAEWQPPEPAKQQWSQSGSLKGLSQAEKTEDAAPLSKEPQQTAKLSAVEQVDAGTSPRRTSRRNYATLVSALQTLGYSIPGFIATAVLTLDGHPIAQVTVDDLDISSLYGSFSSLLQGILHSLDQLSGGDYEETTIASADRHIFLRLLDSNKGIFHVLITTRESDPAAGLKVMASVEAAIDAALQ